MSIVNSGASAHRGRADDNRKVIIMGEIFRLIDKKLRTIIREELNTTGSTNSERSQLKNGVYLVYNDGTFLPFTGSEPKEDVRSIGIAYDGHAFQVALKDLGEWPLFRNYEDCPEKSPFYKSECEGLHDWDFVSSTNHIKEIGTDIPLPEGWYIPTLAVLEVMCLLKKEINGAIKFAGGKPMPNDFHWSSTESYRSNARGVLFTGGIAYSTGKYYSYVVRPVTHCRTAQAHQG